MPLVRSLHSLIGGGLALLASCVPWGTAGASELPSFAPDSYALTERALTSYQELAENGGWQPIPAIAIGLKAGSTGKLVLALRDRLAATRDLDPDLPRSRIFDEDLQAALIRFQARHGLSQTGAIGKLTLTALNVPVETRIEQLDATLSRLTSEKFAFGDRYVVVNLPAATLETVDGGVVTRRYTTIVGRQDRPSPTLQTRITAANILPYWHVPRSMVRADIMPKQARDPGFLAKSHMRLIGAKGNEINPATIDWSGASPLDFTVRQDPGPDNSLGQLRIDMPNPYAVFMHDTPHKEGFARDVRWQSSGCVRVEGVEDFAAWLLEGSQWTPDAIATQIASGQQKTVQLSKPVPVAWVYFTAWGARDGTVQFRPDIYKLDNPMGVLMSTIGPPFHRDRPKAAAKPAPAPDTTGTIKARAKPRPAPKPAQR